MTEYDAAANPSAVNLTFADADISELGQDRLSRGNFCREVSRLIDSVPIGAHSTVFGLVGPWGSGKTSVLNLVTKELKRQGNIAVAQFSPWAVSDSSSLLVEFFAALLGAHESLKGASRRRTFAKLARKTMPVIGSLGVVGKTVGASLEVLLKDGSWAEQFARLDRIIGSSGARVLITVDDVDRLHGVEVLTLLKTIRLLGRFRNVHYLLAYDHDALAEALSPSLGGSSDRASEYLEKIVQYPLSIPPAQESQLKGILDQGLQSLFHDDVTAVVSGAEGRFDYIYNTQMTNWLTTVRSVKRFVAQSRHYYELVAGDVDVADFLILTFLRLHFPKVYDRLPTWRSELLGETVSGNQRDKAVWLDRIQKAGVDEDNCARLWELLKWVFPNAAGNVSSSSNLKRIANKHYFQRYFVFGIPEDDVSDVQVNADWTHAKMTRQHDATAYELSFTNASKKVRFMSIEKAEATVKDLEDSEVPNLLLFTVWLMHREQEADPRYMFGVLLGDLLVKHKGFESEQECESVCRQLPGVRSLRSALDRAETMMTYATSSGSSGSSDGNGSRAVEQVKAATTLIGAQELIDFANSGSPDGNWRNFMETYGVLESHGDLSQAQAFLTAALKDQSFNLVDFAAFFVYIDFERSRGNYVLKDLDVDRLLKLISPSVMYEVDLPKPTAEGAVERSQTAWPNRRHLALQGLHDWRETSHSAPSC